MKYDLYKPKPNQKDFGVVELVLLLLIGGIIIGGSYYLITLKG